MNEPRYGVSGGTYCAVGTMSTIGQSENGCYVVRHYLAVDVDAKGQIVWQPDPESPPDQPLLFPRPVWD